jgi:1-deoxy-D-xylulose-5-phosphate reductoisomerase
MEAGWLFSVTADQVEVVIQRQSIVHSAVQFVDGAVIAQMGMPDMRLPIQYAMFYPDRRPMETERLDLFKLGSVSFARPDMETFRGLPLAYAAMKKGGSMPTVFNAANEAAVARFLDRRISFLQIYEMIEECCSMHKVIPNPTVQEILDVQKSVMEHIRTVWDKD